jgi:predicted RNA-binding Zn-ribbon protein involved in translation (DUF1610 family)
MSNRAIYPVQTIEEETSESQPRPKMPTDSEGKRPTFETSHHSIAGYFSFMNNPTNRQAPGNGSPNQTTAKDTPNDSTPTGPKSFSCPHCGQAYKFSTQIIGREMQCRSCQGKFTVQHNGMTEKTISKPSNRQASSSARRSTRDSNNSSRRRALENGLQDQRNPSRGSSRHEAIDSDRLNAAAEQALRSIETKEEASNGSSRIEKKDEKKSFRSRLSNSGEAAGRRRKWRRASLFAIIVVTAAWAWSSSKPNPKADAIRAFSNQDQVSLTSNTSIGHRKGQEFLGNGTIDPITSLDDVIINESKLVDLSALKQILGDLAPAVHGELWAPSDQAAAVRLKWEQSDTVSEAQRAKVIRLMTQDGLKIRLHSKIDSKLRQQTAPTNILADLVNAPLLAGTPHIIQEMQEDNLPQSIEVAAFNGKGGWLHLSQKTRVEVRYQGLLIKFSGKKPWSNTWRVAKIKSTGKM